MKTLSICAKARRSRVFRDVVVLLLPSALAACGGKSATAVESSDAAIRDFGASDAGTSDARTRDVGVSDVGDGCPSDFTAEGSPCTPEGMSCLSSCSGPCGWCNGLVCSGGHWMAMEGAPPPSCTDADAGARRHPDARLTWQVEEGVVGRGPAVIVSGSGGVQVWKAQSGFDPAGMPNTPPDMTFTVGGAQVDALFDAWSSTNVKGLPHPGPSAECSSVVSVTMCAGCDATTLPSYSNAVDLEPEMESVWAWFDAYLATSSNAALPRSYCRF